MSKGRVTNHVRERRKALGLTQQELANQVGATRQTIIALEAEKYAPSLLLAFRIAHVFKAPFEEVFGYSED